MNDQGHGNGTAQDEVDPVVDFLRQLPRRPSDPLHRPVVGSTVVVGYGNYLGLCRLGKFIAGALDLELTQFTCTVGIASTGDVPKRDLGVLADALRAMVEGGPAMALNGESHVNAG